jgi:hypothetical protein
MANKLVMYLPALRGIPAPIYLKTLKATHPLPESFKHQQKNQRDKQWSDSGIN